MLRAAAMLVLVGAAAPALADPVSLPTGSIAFAQGWVVQLHAPGYLGASPDGPRRSEVTVMVLACTPSQPTAQCNPACDEASIRRNFAPRRLEPKSVSRKGGFLRVEFEDEQVRNGRITPYLFERVLCRASGLVVLMAASPQRPGAPREAVESLTAALKWK